MTREENLNGRGHLGDPGSNGSGEDQWRNLVNMAVSFRIL